MGIGRKSSEQGNDNSIQGQLMDQAMTVVNDGFNRVGGSDVEGGIGPTGPKQPALSLDMTDEELLALDKKWETEGMRGRKDLLDRQKRNKEYWLGKQFGSNDDEYNAVDNVIFSQLETLLPMAARQTPSPLIYSRGSTEFRDFATNTAKIVEDIADAEKLRIKIKQALRRWGLFYLGAIKIGFKAENDDISYTTVHTQKLLLDPEGDYDGAEFVGRFIGEKKKEEAELLIKRFPEKEKEISARVGGKLGTMCEYTEWHSREFLFWRFGTIILDKIKNPNWNYPEEKMQTDQFGQEQPAQVTKQNHFPTPKYPYSFMWVFNLGESPFDETCLVEQAIPLQDAVNKRTRQIDRNADDTNNGWVLNNQFDVDSAAAAVRSLRKGGAIVAPTTNINESVMRMTAPNLAPYVINDLYDKRNQVANIMGTQGSSAAGIATEKTVRGKIEMSQKDVDRLSLIVEHVEQMVDYIFNYSVQMIFTYYDQGNCVRALGQELGTQYWMLLEAPDKPQLIVSVKEGSMIPQDPLMKRNEAVELAQAQLLDPLTLYERMDMPNPQETATRLMQYKAGQIPGAETMQAPGMPMEAAHEPAAPVPQTPGLPPI